MADKKAPNGYDLSRKYYAWGFEHPEDFKPTVTALFFYLVEKWNRLGWKDQFSMTAMECMQGMGVSGYNTYKGAFDVLVKHGIVEVVKKSCNHHQANVISLLKFNALTDVVANALTDVVKEEVTDVVTETFFKPIKQETIKPKTKENIPPQSPMGEVRPNLNTEKDSFDDLIHTYGQSPRTPDKQKAKEIWDTLRLTDRIYIINNLNSLEKAAKRKGQRQRPSLSRIIQTASKHD